MFAVGVFASEIGGVGAPGAQGPAGDAGTNAPTGVPIDGGIVYGAALAYASTAAGTTGQCITSNGANAPTWGACGAWNGVFSAWAQSALGTGTLNTVAATKMAKAGNTGTLMFTPMDTSASAGNMTIAVVRGDAGVICQPTVPCNRTAFSPIALTCASASVAASEVLLLRSLDAVCTNWSGTIELQLTQ